MHSLYSLSVCTLALTAALPLPYSAAMAKEPSFNCDAAKTKVEKLVCEDKLLSALDAKMAAVYKEARAKNAKDKSIAAGQVDWMKRRNKCENDPELYDCVKREYALRLSYLQAKYDMASVAEHSKYKCTMNMHAGEGAPAPKVTGVHAMSYETVIPSVKIKIGDDTRVAFLGRVDGALRYAGDGVSLYRDAGQSMIKMSDDVYSCEAY